MFLYITSRLNQGYKLGIANDIDQRQQQYTTLIPNIKFHLAVQTGSAEEIETSFKQKFLDHRIINKTSTREMKSEVYQIKLKYLIMHFMNCMHMNQRTAILIDNNLAFSQNEYLDNKINLYLSNYYIPFKDKNEKFEKFNYSKIYPKIKIGEISSAAAEFQNKEMTQHTGKLEFYDFNEESWYKISNLYLENDLIDQDKIIKDLNLKKKEKIYDGMNITSSLYLSPSRRALSFISNLWFKKLIDFKVLRNYSIKKLDEHGGWTTQRLRFLGQPYRLESTKIKLNE